MVFYTVIMAIIDLSVSWMLIGQDLRRTGGPLQGTMCLLEGIKSHGKVRNRVLSPDLMQSLNIERWHNPYVRSCGFINS